jgi:hypothetical protein
MQAMRRRIGRLTDDLEGHDMEDRGAAVAPRSVLRLDWLARPALSLRTQNENRGQEASEDDEHDAPAVRGRRAGGPAGI